MDNQNFLGRGMKFPPQINLATGRFVCSEGIENIKESVYLILMTQKTERLMSPRYGSSVQSYVFNTTDSTLLNLMAMELENDILRCEPRIASVDIRMDSTSRQGCLFVYVDYTVRGSNVSENMVFPFYLGEEPKKERDAYETMEDDYIE